jgi:anti-sigma B factor antagonist
MEIEKTYEGTCLTLTLRGKLDTDTSHQLTEALAGALGGITELVLDMTDLTYISSAGLRALLSARKAMAKQGRLELRGVRSSIRQVLEITGFSQLLDLE